MVAKLISPQGEEFELTDEQFAQAKALLDEEIELEREKKYQEFVAYRQQTHPHLTEQNQRLLAILDWIQADPHKQSDEWWDDFEQFLKENRFNIRERDLGLDND